MSKRTTQKVTELAKGALQIVSAGNGSGNEPPLQNRLDSKISLNTYPASQLKK